MKDETLFLTLPDRTLAYRRTLEHRDRAGKTPLFFLPGYASDMTGSKASFLAEQAQAAGRGLLRFDYRGHGQSSGDFMEGTLGAWLDDALTVFDRLTQGPQILIGSSMGGWIALLVALARPERVAGLIGVAAAPDFTHDLVLPNLTPLQRQQLERQGFTYDDNDPPDRRTPITRRLLEEAETRLVLRSPLPLTMPIRLLQGQQDSQVPWQTALRLAQTVTGQDVRVTFLKDGEHGLSRPSDLALLWQMVETV